MAAPANASLPPFFTLTRGMQVRITALDPTTGALVGGVVLSSMALSVDQEDVGGSGNIPISPVLLPGTETFV